MALILLAACSDRSSPVVSENKSIGKDTVVKLDTIYQVNDWQQSFGLTHDPSFDSIWGKPVKFFIENLKCSPLAIDFYYGSFRPTDNNSTATLLALATTNDNQLRPFYRWCLNKTIQIQDGALAEYTGQPARQYAEKFPAEFFEYMDHDTTGEKYNDWVTAISYSSYNDLDDYKQPLEIRKQMTETMKQNCINCNRQLIRRIDKFAADCFE